MEYAKVKARLKELDEEETRLAGILKARIGEHAGIDGICTWKQVKGRTVINWQAAALEMGAGKNVIEKHTETKPGFRTLRINKEILKGD